MFNFALGTILTNDAAMELAIEQALLGSNQVSPNPPVGCVVLDKNKKLLSYGYHQRFGEAHAEVNALKSLSVEALTGAHVFVTLEPCSHYGKTPPCSDLVASFPIASLTYGWQDPNPQVAGRGLEKIRAQGIEVIKYDKLQNELEDLLLTFKFHLNHKEAFFALKAATSLDGAIADSNNKSQWITSVESRNYNHLFRSRYQAMLVGKGTVLADDPLLTTRHANFVDHKNKVLVLDPDLELLGSIQTKNIYKARQSRDIYLVTSHALASQLEAVEGSLYRDPKSGVMVIGLPLIDGQLDLHALKQLLPSFNIYDVYIEGGAVTYSSFIKQGAFDHIYLFQAPILLGTEKSKHWTSALSRTLAEKVELILVSVKRLGTDVLLQYSKK
jgi:diaminohydroxyphosphoribosylaminopyrimidine deaminase/5-amino-6-(5-phosphoribosylamino)uracil reductase